MESPTIDGTDIGVDAIEHFLNVLAADGRGAVGSFTVRLTIDEHNTPVAEVEIANPVFDDETLTFPTTKVTRITGFGGITTLTLASLYAEIISTTNELVASGEAQSEIIGDDTWLATSAGVDAIVAEDTDEDTAAAVRRCFGQS